MIDIYVANSCVGSHDLGRGIFARNKISAGEFVLGFTGKIITLEEARAKGNEMGNPLQINFETYIDVEPPGLYINHSCEPNCGIVDDIKLIALRPIIASEELTFDYSTTMWEPWDGAWKLSCLCGSSRCRGTISSFYDLPSDIQNYYLLLGMVQKFIKDLKSPTKLNTDRRC